MVAESVFCTEGDPVKRRLAQFMLVSMIAVVPYTATPYIAPAAAADLTTCLTTACVQQVMDNVFTSTGCNGGGNCCANHPGLPVCGGGDCQPYCATAGSDPGTSTP